ncbi:exported hypothetical protein [Cupriavidus taiwanensis]|uniref:Secreted protein n=1 Tax=Cupriavidus taiwanensis TaxID=164546 RepID=A0A375BQ62_9BURK|nr:exported hypothetical protein [Cupriavidus taiwanensis]
MVAVTKAASAAARAVAAAIAAKRRAVAAMAAAVAHRAAVASRAAPRAVRSSRRRTVSRIWTTIFRSDPPLRETGEKDPRMALFTEGFFVFPWTGPQPGPSIDFPFRSRFPDASVIRYVRQSGNIPMSLAPYPRL